MRNRLFQRSRARTCKQLKNYEESVAKGTDRARHLRTDELSLQQEKIPTAVSRLLTQFQDLHKKGEFLDRCERIFTIPSTTTKLWCDSGFPHDPRNTMGTSGNGFESLPV